MADLGKKTRLNRIFGHASGRMLGVAADHMINYPVGMPDGLRDIARTVARIVEGRPSAITLNKGIALRCLAPYAGIVPLIVQQMAITPRCLGYADHVTPEEAIGMGADAIAVSILLGRDDELPNMRLLSETVREAERFGLPVLPHIYPMRREGEVWAVSIAPEDIFYAARAGVEMGADAVKVPFTGDVASYGDIVRATPVPVVAAGGPRCDTLDDAVDMARKVVASGAAGAVVGRNVWGFEDIPVAIARLKEVYLA